MNASTSTAGDNQAGPTGSPLSMSAHGSQHDRALYLKALRNLDTLASWDQPAPDGGIGSLSSRSANGVFERRKSRKDPLANAPKLKALLEKQRARERARNPLPEPVLPDIPYRPYSADDFMRRLSTFKILTYREQREGLDPPSAARCGWVNDGRNRLRCEWCKEAWVLQTEKGQSKKEAETLYAQQKQQLIDSHRASCPWHLLQCDPSIYQLQMHSREKFVKEAVERAITVTPLITHVEIAYPFSEREAATIINWFEKLSPTISQTEGQPQPPFYSDNAAILGLLGWTASTLDAPMARMSRRSSALPAQAAIAGTDPSTPARSSANLHKPVIQCVLCNNKVGLWSFTPKVPVPPPSDSMELDTAPGLDTPESLRRSVTRRSPSKLDPIREHQPYCPYVTRNVMKSAYTITLPPSGGGKQPDELVEGWRAIVYVMTRKTSADRAEDRRQARLKAERDGVEAVDDGDKDDIDMVIDYVEQHGARELTRYLNKLIK